MSQPDDVDQFDTAKSSKVRSLIERFEQAWEAQQDTSRGIDLAPFLPDAGDPSRLAALHELIKADLVARWGRGLPTSLEHYVEKFPEIGPIEKVSPRLIYDEFRIRTQHGFPAPLSQYRARFPAQFPEVEGLIQTEQSNMTAPENLTRPSNATEGLANTGSLPSSESTSPLALLKQGILVGGHYTLTKRIGSGGFGEVWLGNDIHGNIPKAIKIISRSVESDEAKQELHALEIIKRLNHPYLLRTEGFFAEQERLIVVMELADGSLREMLKKAKKETDSGLPVEKLLVYMKHAAEALDYLHEEGIFHRDIKPENILLVGKMAKVADFGLAKLAANRQSTKTNFAGTSAYSSPETWKGRVTAKSDLYSLAVTYGELRLGRPVYKGSTIYEFMVEHLQSQPQLDPMPDAEREVVLRALAKDPADRFGNCSEFVRALESAVAGPGMLPATGGAPRTSVSGAPTPVSKWQTPASNRTANASGNLSTQRGGPSPSKPSWKNSPSQAEIELPEPEPTYRRPRRRRGPNYVVLGLAAVLVGCLGIGGLSLLARSRVETQVQDKIAQRDFTGALKVIDDGGVLVTPFKERLRDSVLEKGVEQAEKAQKSNNLEDLIKTTVALVNSFPKDDKAPKMLDDALKSQIPELIRKEKYSDAYRMLVNLNLNVPAKTDLMATVGREWLTKAWVEMDNDDYTEAKQISQQILDVDPDQKEARTLNDLATVADSEKDLLFRAKYADILKKLPRQVPPRAAKLVEKIRAETRTAWLKQADSLIQAKKLGEAQQSLVEFSDYFRNDSEGTARLKSTFNELFKDFFAKGRYEDAFSLLEKTNFEFPDLVENVKIAWRDAEVARFENGSEREKEQALQGLAKLAKQFATDLTLQDKYSEFRKAFVSVLFPQIEESLTKKQFQKAIDLIQKAEPYVLDPGQDIQLKSLELLATVQSPDFNAGEFKTVERLLGQVLRNPEKASKLNEILSGVLKVAKDDPAALNQLRPELLKFRDVFADEKLPADFWLIPGMVKSDPNVQATGAKKVLSDATKLFNTQEFDQSLKTLRQIDVRKETDRAIKRDYYTLYAKLGEKGALSRDQILGLEPVLADHPEIKPYLSKAMTQTIGRTWMTWPTGGDTWESRIKDAEYAEADQPIVQAFKAEGLIESGKTVDFALTPATGDEKAYVNYVRAVAAASSKKRDDLVNAAKALEKVSAKDAWLVPSRRERAAKILEAAANEVLKSSDGTPRVFETAQEANQTFLWLDKALQLTGKSLKDGGSLPGDGPYALALAAACKSPPDFELNKTLGEPLLAKTSKLPLAAKIALVLSNPSAFAAELKSLKSEGQIGVGEIGGLLLVGDSQLATAADVPELNQRQAALYALEGWALEQAPQKNNELIAKAYSRASKLDPTNDAILVAKGRYGAVVALAEASKETNSTAKIEILEQGMKSTDAPIRKKLVNDDRWAELCLTRSQLALELGNEYYATKQREELKDRFEQAKLYAEMARDAKIPASNQADVWLALGNAYEDLAHFARVEPAKYYDEAAKALDKAASLNPEYAYNAGRSRYRWTNDAAAPLDEAKKKSILTTALASLTPAATNKRHPNAAEANYWEGYVNWALGNLPDAVRSFERTIKLAEKNDVAALWGKYSLDGLVMLIQRSIDSDPSRAVEWVDEAESAYRPVKNIPAFKGSDQALADVAAEASMGLARKHLKAGEFSKIRPLINRAFEANHSTKRHLIAIERAAISKKNASKLELTTQNLNEIRDQTISAIDASTNLTDVQRQKLKSDFEEAWRK